MLERAVASIGPRVGYVAEPRRHDAPDGLLVHSAGPAPDGWYVYDIWETKAKFERFGEMQPGPAVRDTIGADFDERGPDFYEIANLVPGRDAGMKGVLTRT